MPGNFDASRQRMFEASRRAGELGQQRRDTRSLAQIGAERLSQYGPQGQQWADALIRDPRGAILAAEQYGGMGAIEQSLAAAASSAQAQEARSAMSPEQLVRSLANAGDGTNAKSVAEALGLGGGGERKILKGADGYNYYADTQERVLPGVQKGGSAGIDTDTAFKLRKQYLDSSGDFSTIRHYYEVAASNLREAAKNPAGAGGADFALVQAYGKMLDPNSVVRNEEGKFIVENTSSGVADALNSVLRLFSPAGTLNPEARFTLIKQIQATYDSAAEGQAKKVAEFQSELGRLGASGNALEIALPEGLGPTQVQIDFEPWDLKDKGVPSVEDISKMKEVTLPDGTRLTRGVNGEWEAVE